jgi:hypothetical protein
VGKRKLAFGSILRMLLRLTALTLTVFTVLPLVGCAETSATADSNQRFSELIKPYDKTLTRTQQKETISELQNAQAKKTEDGAAEGQAATGTTPSTN